MLKSVEFRFLLDHELYSASCPQPGQINFFFPKVLKVVDSRSTSALGRGDNF